MPLAHGAKAHHETAAAALEARLVGMRHDGRVHQRGGGIGIFVTEIGADQTAALFAELQPVEAQILDHLVETLLEDVLGLPVSLGKVPADSVVFRGDLLFGQLHDIVDQPLCATAFRRLRLPAEVKRTQHDPRGVGAQPILEDAERGLR